MYPPNSFILDAISNYFSWFIIISGKGITSMVYLINPLG